MRHITLLTLHLALIAIAMASKAVEPKPTSWWKRLQGPVVEEKPVPKSEDDEKPKFSIFTFGRKTSEKEGQVEVDPVEDGRENRNRFGFKKKASNDESKAGSTVDNKNEESKPNVEESSSQKTPPEATGIQESIEPATNADSDKHEDEDEVQAQPRTRFFRFGAGIKEKESTNKVTNADEPSSAPTRTSPADAADADQRSISDNEKRPADLPNDDVLEQRQSKPRPLRFGVRVKEAKNVDPKNETAKSSADVMVDGKGLVDSLEESKSVEAPKDENVGKQPSKQTMFGFEVGASENDDATESSTNVTSIDKGSEAVNATRPEETSDDKPAPLVPHSQGVPMGFPMQPQQPGGGLIIMGLDGRAQRGMPPLQQQPGQPTPTTALVAEAYAAVFATIIRYWFLPSFTRWFADAEMKSLRKPTQRFQWERLNDRHAKDSDALQTALRTPPTGVSERRWRHHVKRQLRKEQQLALKKERNVRKDLGEMFDRTVVVVELAKTAKGDFDMTHLEDVVTFILTEHRRKAFGVHNSTAVELEVVVLVESPGGEVSAFGLGAAQIRRLTDEVGIVTTVCVDKVAASGGYMIASQASKVVAAPFAVVGSIGVIRAGLNFNKALQKYGIMPMVLTAGDAKAPLSVYGEITKGGLEIAQRNLEKIHGAFRELVVRGRPALVGTMEEVADGDIYLGLEALELKLVDEVMTSEEYIMHRVQAGDRVLKLHRIPHYMNRRLASIHPLDFLRENGPRWLAQHDIPKILSRVLQTSAFLKFVQYLVHNRLI